MRAPRESLDDFINLTASRRPATPPRLRSLRPSGTFEVLKPLAGSEYLSEREEYPVSGSLGFASQLRAYRLSWFHRSLAGGGAFALFAVILAGVIHIGSVIYIEIDSRPVEPGVSLNEVDVNEEPENSPVFSSGRDAVDDWAAKGFSRASVRPRGARVAPAVRSRPAARRIVRAAYRPLIVVSDFVPTTLIIYVENGEIRTRVEPWLSYRPRKGRRVQIV